MTTIKADRELLADIDVKNVAINMGQGARIVQDFDNDKSSQCIWRLMVGEDVGDLLAISFYYLLDEMDNADVHALVEANPGSGWIYVGYIMSTSKETARILAGNEPISRVNLDDIEGLDSVTYSERIHLACVIAIQNAVTILSDIHYAFSRGRIGEQIA